MSVRALPSHTDHLAAFLEGLEEFLFDPIERREVASVSALLAEDFREFGSSGRVYTKLDILSELSTEQPAMVTITEFTCDLVSPGVALVTYKSLTTHESRAQTRELRSSIWAQRPVQPYATPGVGREMRWQMIFHQGTRF
jgi:hypothetical protein